MSDRRSNTSFLIGLAVSACAHILALTSLQHIKIDPHRAKISLASLAAMTPISAEKFPPEDPNKPAPTPQTPPNQVPLPPPVDHDKDVRFGIDNATIESKTWLGTLEGDTPTGPQGAVDQAALALDPGEPGKESPPQPAAAATPVTPTPPSPSPTPPPAPEPRPEANTEAKAETAPTPEAQPKPDDATPTKAIVPAPAPEKTAPVAPSPDTGVSGETAPSKDPLTPTAGAPDSKSTEHRDEAKPSDPPTPEKAKEAAVDKPDTKIGEKTDGVDRPNDSEKKSAHDGKGEDDKEAKDASPTTPEKVLEEVAKIAPPTESAVPTPTTVSTAPTAPNPPPPSPPTNAAQPPSKPDGGQSKLKGAKSDRESEAFATKPLEVPMRNGQVAAGRGLRIITRRADFTTTTLLTSPPHDAMVRISFLRNGNVKKAEFLDGSATGNPNVDDPLMNAIYRWRASGSDLLSLKDTDTLSVIVRVTFK